MGQRITWDPALAEGLRRGLSLCVLGQAALPPPLSRLLVLGRSDAAPHGHMSLAAVVMPAAEGGTLPLALLGLGRYAGATRVTSALGEQLATRQAKDGFYVLDASGADQFLVAKGIMQHVTVTCGVWPVLRPLVGARAPARPLTDRERTAADLDRFCELILTLLTGIYEREKASLPELTLVLEPTGANVRSAVNGLRRIGESTARVLTRFPGQGAPGRAYEPETEGGDEPVGFGDVGGQDAARAELETICLAVREPHAFRAWGARPPRGVLLYGPPGTGKTLLARALAHESGARFLHVRATDVVSKWYGEAERRLQQAFDRARSEAPAVLFFDEVDALARDREVSHEATHRIVSTFLENMDGLREAEGVIVLAATNRPGAVDDAMLRPGRFDRLVEVPLPGREGRRAIFEVHLRRAERRAGRRLFEPLDEAAWQRLLDASKGFSGAEAAEAVRRALEVKVRSGATAGQVTVDELVAAAGGVGRPF